MIINILLVLIAIGFLINYAVLKDDVKFGTEDFNQVGAILLGIAIVLLLIKYVGW